MLQVKEGHVGIGDIVLKANPDADTSKFLRKQKTAHKNAVTAADQVTFWATMPHFKVVMGLENCTLWSMRSSLSGLVMSVPTQRLAKV